MKLQDKFNLLRNVRSYKVARPEQQHVQAQKEKANQNYKKMMGRIDHDTLYA